VVKANSGEHDLVIRRAMQYDLSAIVRMLADDPLGATREVSVSSLPESYHRAFEAIDHDPNNSLVVAEMAGEVVGVLQLTFIPNITYQGGASPDRRCPHLGRQSIERAWPAALQLDH